MRRRHDIPALKPRNRALPAAVLLLAGCVVAPQREVLPYPDHVRAGVSVGDSIEVVTREGEKYRLEVDSIGGQSLAGDGIELRYDRIRSIRKRSVAPIANPCDDGTPVGCSVPTVVRLADEYHDRYARRFEDACIAHDYCYRHGHATYGDRRADCDRMFLDDMKTSCNDRLELDPGNAAECRLAASEFHLAVRRSGAKRFRSGDSSYCEYRGPPR